MNVVRRGAEHVQTLSKLLGSRRGKTRFDSLLELALLELECERREKERQSVKTRLDGLDRRLAQMRSNAASLRASTAAGGATVATAGAVTGRASAEASSAELPRNGRRRTLHY